MKLLLWTLFFTSAALAAKNLETVYEWRYIDYLWDSPAQRDQFVRNGDYDYPNIIPIDVDRARDGRVFITTIRDVGVPASLAVVTDKLGPSGPLVKPYPGWSWYRRGDCDGITSVFRVAIDECNKMYVLDTGIIGEEYVCPAQVLVFDLGTDQLVKRIRIPDNVSRNRAGIGTLCTPVVQVKGPYCELVNLFMADVNGHGLVIHNKHRTFRLEAQAFEPEPAHVNVTIAGETFELEDSLMGLAVSPVIFENEGSDLIFRPFSSRALYTAHTEVLSRSNFGDAIKYKYNLDMLPSQASVMGFSSQGTLFYGLTREVAIGCWNRYTEMRKENTDIAVQDRERLQFMSGLKVLPSSRTNGKEEVWVLSNRLQKISTGTVNYDEINFRVVKGSVDDLIRGTRCYLPPKMRPQHHQCSFSVKRMLSLGNV